jgi:dUTP pyrophosphatase
MEDNCLEGILQTLKIMKKREGASIPQRATEGAAGLDLCACIEEELVLQPRELCTVPTGIAIALPGRQYAAFVFARSGLGVRHGISLSNGVGVIDSDYRGEIAVGLCNLGHEPYTIRPGERIAQLVVMPVCPLPVEEVAALDGTARGEGGFGSTGR